MESIIEMTTLPTTTLPGVSGVEYNLAERIIEAVILTIILIVAVSGNVMLWIVIFQRRSLRTTSNALILCLSSADLLVSLINMPFTIFTILMGDWIFGELTCIFLGFLNMVTFIASVMSLGAISINRYILIVHANKFRKVYTKRNTALFIAGVWGLSFALASPPLLGWASYGYLEGQSFCFCQWTENIAYTFFMVGCCFGGPCSVMTYCYTKILRVFKNSQKTMFRDSMSDRRESVGSTKDSRIVKLRTKLEPVYRRRKSLPFENSNSDDRALTKTDERGISINGNDTNMATQMMVSQPTGLMTTFQPLSNHTSTTVCTNANNAVGESSSYLSSPSTSPDVMEKEPITVKTPEYTKRDTIQGVRDSKRWKSPFKNNGKKNKSRHSRVPSISIQPDTISTDDFSNPFASPVHVINNDVHTSGHGQRSVPVGLYGTPNGPSSSRIARKKKRREEEMRLTKSFLVVIFAFILCWFPFCITMFWSVFIRDPTKSVPRPIDMASLLLGFANSCCNPIIYGVMNRKFRVGFKSLFCWWKNHNEIKPWKPPNSSQP